MFCCITLYYIICHQSQVDPVHTGVFEMSSVPLKLRSLFEEAVNVKHVGTLPRSSVVCSVTHSLVHQEALGSAKEERRLILTCS